MGQSESTPNGTNVGGIVEPLLSAHDGSPQVIPRGPDLVQFAALVCFAKEGHADGKLQVDVMRIGVLKGACSVGWKTEDGSAEAGLKYIAGTGTVEFEDGEYDKVIEVDIMDDEHWCGDLEFKIHLVDPIGCTIDKYQGHCRVKILDDDYFPGNKYAHEIRRGGEGIEEIPAVALLLEFVKHCMRTKGVGKRAILIAIMDQTHNAYYLVKTYLLSIYMVDYLFNDATEEDAHVGGSRMRAVYFVAVLFALPMFVTHLWDYTRARLDLAGDLRSHLQTVLFHRYLNYVDEKRQETPPSEIIRVVLGEVQEIVDAGFMKCFGIIALVGKLVIVMFFILSENAQAVWVVIAFPTAMAVWLYLRNPQIIAQSEAVVNAEKMLADRVQSTCEQFQLVVDYKRKGRTADEFAEYAIELNERKLPKELITVNNEYFPRWLAVMLTMAYIISFAPDVFSGVLSLGKFLAMVKIFSEIGEEFEEAYEQLMDLFSVVGPLQKVTEYMNVASDIEHRREVYLNTRDATMMRFQERVTKDRHFDTSQIADGLNIEINAIKFEYPSSHGRTSPYSLVTDSLVVRQGSIVSVIGDHTAGKATFMKLVSGILHPPSKGDSLPGIFIPMHLRVLHVSHDAMIMKKGIWGNLTFGRDHPRKERVKKILRRLCQEDRDEETELERQVEREHKDKTLMMGDGHKWRHGLSSTERTIVHLARALIMNPEVLCLEHPTSAFDAVAKQRILAIIKEHRTNRGFEILAGGGADSDTSHRRPRTVVFSTNYKAAARESDMCVHLEASKETSAATVKLVSSSQLEDSKYVFLL